MDFLSRMNRVSEYIEVHLSEDMPYDELAAIVGCGVYQFGRIFAYVVGVPLSEYIRRRRLSQAALDLQGGHIKVIDTALKYGYTSPDAFTRAFASMHGATPNEARRTGTKLKLYPRITFHITIKGDTSMDYRIETMDAVQCVGITRNFGKITVNTEAEHWKEARPDIWQFWDHFLDHGMNLVIRDKYKLYRAPFWQVGVTETLDNGDTVVQIGAQSRDGEAYPELTAFTIPASTWAVFTAKGTLNQREHPISRAMLRARTEWLPSSGYELLSNMTLEVYGPGNTGLNDYSCELWLPVRAI